MDIRVKSNWIQLFQRTKRVEILMDYLYKYSIKGPFEHVGTVILRRLWRKQIDNIYKVSLTYAHGNSVFVKINDSKWMHIETKRKWN